MALYLDIETTYQGKLTVIGLNHGGMETIQLVGEDCTKAKLEAVLPMAICVYTYNGDRCDLRIIKEQLGVDLASRYRSVDLMLTCKRAKIYGGLKHAEQVLGIKRIHEGMSGKDAVALWYTYERDGDQEALQKLLAYNREDVENLITLREKLEHRLSRC